MAQLSAVVQLWQFTSLQISVHFEPSELRLYPDSQVPHAVPAQLRQLATVHDVLPHSAPLLMGRKPVLQVSQTVAEEHFMHF